MTTALDLEFQAEVPLLTAEFGTPATFYTYPSQTQDDSESTVTQGAATTFAPKILGPLITTTKAGGAEFGNETEVKVLTFVLGTGVGDVPIGFTPFFGQRVDYPVGGDRWAITNLTKLRPGDNIVAYEVEAKE